MIKLMEWLLGRTPATPSAAPEEASECERQIVETDDLDRRAEEALRHRAEAAAARTRAERLGAGLRQELRYNHFGERIRYALHQEGWDPR